MGLLFSSNIYILF